MTRYFIKETVTGTEVNPNFAGVTNIFYCGKGGYFTTGGHRPSMDYGYMSAKVAENSIKRRIQADKDFATYCKSAHPEYHTRKYEVVEVTV